MLKNAMQELKHARLSRHGSMNFEPWQQVSNL